VPFTFVSSKGPVPAPTGLTVFPRYAFAARIDSCGELSRCGTSGSSVPVVTATESPSAFTVRSTPSRMRGLGEAVAALVSDRTTDSAVSFVPSWKVTPSRIPNVQVRPLCCHLVARAGSASPSASSVTSVSAVDQRDSLNASSDSGDSPERGGFIIAMRTRLPSPPAESSEADSEKHPVSSRAEAAVTADRGRRRADRRTEHSG
jgi:hypothetical protein